MAFLLFVLIERQQRTMRLETSNAASLGFRGASDSADGADFICRDHGQREQATV